MSADRVQLVCFDLGRVLIRIADGWEGACERAGIPWGPPRDRAEVDALFGRYEVGRIECDALCEQLAALSDGRWTADGVRRAVEAWLIGPYPGVDELLDDLDAAGVQTACLSNTTAMHWRLMTAPTGPAALPLHRLTHRFASQLIGAAKPNPAIYEHLERETGFRGPQIVFFDDLEANVAAALARGWRAHRIDPALDDPIGQAREHLKRYDVLHDGERTGIR